MVGRRGSHGSLENIWKKKTEKQVKEENKRKDVFKSSKKTVRSPDVEKEMEREVDEIMRKLIKEELEVFLMKEIREIKRWREEVKGWREKIKEEIRGGLNKHGERLKKELEGMRKELREKEETWREEKRR